MDFAVPGEHCVKLEESKNINKYEDLFIELKRLCNMKVIGDARGVMVIVVGNGDCDTSSNPGRD